MSGEARGVLAALAGMPAVDKRATLLQLIDMWRGLKPDEVRRPKERPKLNIALEARHWNITAIRVRCCGHLPFISTFLSDISPA